jgi:hypothetical protein
MIFFGGFIFLILTWFFFKKAGSDYPRLFWSAFFYKCAMAIALGLVYLHYYKSNDTWLFFYDAVKAAELGRTDFGEYIQFLWNSESSNPIMISLVNTQERSLFLVKIISITCLLTADNYWLCSIYFASISFFASWFLFASVSRHFDNSYREAALAFLFYPSVLFWSSGLVKETLALAGIYFLATIFIKMVGSNRISILEWIIAVLAFYFSWNLKYYWTALFMAVAITSVMYIYFKCRRLISTKYQFLTWMFIFIVLCAAFSLMHPNFYLNRFLDVLITNHNDFVAISKPDALIHFYQLEPSWISIFINSPWALFSGILRPFLWEANGLTGLLAAIENLIVLVLIGSAFVKRAMPTENRILLFSTLTYIVLLCIFLTLSTPNLGTLSRYRVGFLPFLVFAVSYRNPLLKYLSERINQVRQ